MSETKTVAELATEAYGWFETAYRGDDPEQPFTRLKDDAPEWVTDLVMEAHGDLFPDDWRYDAICSACGAIGDDDLGEDSASEWADGNVDVYTGKRLAWLATNLQRVGYVDEAIEEFGTAPSEGIVHMIGLGQYRESEEVFSLVLSALWERRRSRGAARAAETLRGVIDEVAQ